VGRQLLYKVLVCELAAEAQLVEDMWKYKHCVRGSRGGLQPLQVYYLVLLSPLLVSSSVNALPIVFLLIRKALTVRSRTT
jgi:hypothetical protein